MNAQSGKYSWDTLLERGISGYLILLDIDGVLMADGENKIPETVKEHVMQLKQVNDIRIVSNTFRAYRCEYSSRELQIPWVKNPHKKPSKKILSYIQDSKKPMIVIGDKFLTDGIFASRIGAESVLLKRRVAKTDRILIKFTYILDDLSFALVRFLKALRKMIAY